MEALYRHKFLFSWVKTLDMKWHRLRLTFKETAKQFSQVLCHFTFPTAVCESCACSRSFHIWSGHFKIPPIPVRVGRVVVVCISRGLLLSIFPCVYWSLISDVKQAKSLAHEKKMWQFFLTELWIMFSGYRVLCHISLPCCRHFKTCVVINNIRYLKISSSSGCTTKHLSKLLNRPASCDQGAHNIQSYELLKANRENIVWNK